MGLSLPSWGGVRPRKAGSPSMSEPGAWASLPLSAVPAAPAGLWAGFVCPCLRAPPPQPTEAHGHTAFILLGCRWAPSLVFPACVCLCSCACHLCGTPQVPQAPYGLGLGKDIPVPAQQVMTGCCHRIGDGRAHPTAQSIGRDPIGRAQRLGCGSIPWQHYDCC